MNVLKVSVSIAAQSSRRQQVLSCDRSGNNFRSGKYAVKRTGNLPAGMQSSSSEDTFSIWEPVHITAGAISAARNLAVMLHQGRERLRGRGVTCPGPD